jgi:hypothetical protein
MIVALQFRFRRFQGMAAGTHARSTTEAGPRSWLPVVLVLLFGIGAAASENGEAPNVKIICQFDSPDEFRAWKGPVSQGVGSDGKPFIEIGRDRDIFHAVREFRGKAARWADYSWLRLEVESASSGVLNVALREPDGEKLEPWVAVTRLKGGTQSIWIRLAPKPTGDLILGGPQRDREWNPDTEQRLTLTLTPGGGRLRILAIELARQREPVDSRKSAAASADPEQE